MFKRCELLVVLVLLIATATQANILTNGGFELGAGGYMSAGGYAPDGWSVTAGGSGWHQNNPPQVVQGTQSVLLWGADTVVAQIYAVTPHTTYNISLDVINSNAPGLTLSTAGMDLVMYVQSYDAGWNFIEGVEVDRFQSGIDPDNQWTAIGGSYTTPAGAANGQVYFIFEGASGATHISFDNAVVTEGLSRVASDPWPENGSPQVPSVVNAGNLEFTLPDDLSITGVDYDVYFQADDPNMGSVTPVSGSGSSGERIFVAVPETITADHTYYWIVDVDITAEPNVAGFYSGPVWSFTSTNEPPTVDTGEPTTQNVWISGGTAIVSLDGIANDDGLPDPPGALTVSWTKDSGPGSAVFSPSSDGGTTADAASATVAFDTAGDYYLTLAADDGSSVVSDTIQIKVFNEGDDGLVALYEFESTADDTAPIGGNHHGVLNTLDEVDLTLPVIDSLDAQVGSGSLLIGGVGQRVYVPDSGDVDPNWVTGVPTTWADMQDTHQITVSAWIKVAPGLFGNGYASLLTKSSAYGMYRYDIYGTAFFSVGSWDDTHPDGQIAAFDTGIGPILDDGRWHHIAGTYDGATVRYYVDGLLEGETYDSTYLSGMPIGGGVLEWGYGMTGRYDQVRIHDVALSAELIKDQYLADGGGANCRQQYGALPFDLNQNCYVDLGDFAIFASAWLNCSDLFNEDCTADDGVILLGP